MTKPEPDNGVPVEAGTLPEGADPLSLDLQLCFQLYTAANRMVRLYRPLLGELGLTYPQYLVMLVLWERGDRLVGELGEALGLDSGTLTPLLKRLETAGLVARNRDPEDERRVRIGLTRAGSELRARAETVPEEIACRSGITPEDGLALHTLLKRFNA